MGRKAITFHPKNTGDPYGTRTQNASRKTRMITGIFGMGSFSGSFLIDLGKQFPPSFLAALRVRDKTFFRLEFA